jgi:7-dehydrocholesterol reductase
LVLELLPGKTEFGPETLTGHIPKYTDNGVKHCVVSTFLFFAGSNLGWGNFYDFGIMFDVFPSALSFLNIFGLVFCLFLMLKGLHFPSTEDCGSSGSLAKDYLWGTELYPQIMGLDLKRFVNCRFSMSFWQLAGLSFSYRSYTLHGSIDYGLLLSAISQYLYLFKFFWWEMGYMRSIDIIVDRAGFEIQWGCLVYVPAVYTLHSRFCVLSPSILSFPAAFFIFTMSMLGVRNPQSLL